MRASGAKRARSIRQREPFAQRARREQPGQRVVFRAPYVAFTFVRERVGETGMFGQGDDALDRVGAHRVRRGSVDDARAAGVAQQRHRDREGIRRVEAARAALTERRAVSAGQRQRGQRAQVGPCDPHTGEIHHPLAGGGDACELAVFFIKDQDGIDRRRDVADGSVQLGAHRIDRPGRGETEAAHAFDQRGEFHIHAQCPGAGRAIRTLRESARGGGRAPRSRRGPSACPRACRPRTG